LVLEDALYTTWAGAQGVETCCHERELWELTGFYGGSVLVTVEDELLGAVDLLYAHPSDLFAFVSEGFGEK
jgi:hypothetical protein